MKTRLDMVLLEEAARFSLRFACEDCVHFDATGDRCLHGYPPAPRLAALRAPPVSDAERTLAFCKEFELG